jgi:diaminohydroxyphosphoribosylaminopyrimidine deaminase/5-amino-6-(5-phosphoribosylamino)uracil reductase
MDTQAERYMQMALKLAEHGIGSVEPNPAVGCVIEKAGQVIGKGWHRQFGGPHAEINALEDCKNLAASPAGATMYVTLEPCCHEGKTPPCARAIIDAKIACVVVATIDPSAHAAGRGLAELQAAGIRVETGLCEQLARRLNAPFIKFATTQTPWIILKWAQSLDGKLTWSQTAQQQGRRWISNEQSQKDAHRLRRRCQAILVGINTVLADDPLLTARPPKDDQPLRVVLDTCLRIPLTSRLLKTTKKAGVLVVTGPQAEALSPKKAERITHRGGEILTVTAADGKCDIKSVLSELGKRGIQQLLVEGGPTVLTEFLKAGLGDEVCIYLATDLLGPKGAADITTAAAQLTCSISLSYVDVKTFDNNIRISGLLEPASKFITPPSRNPAAVPQNPADTAPPASIPSPEQRL